MPSFHLGNPTRKLYSSEDSSAGRSISAGFPGGS